MADGSGMVRHRWGFKAQVGAGLRAVGWLAPVLAATAFFESTCFLVSGLRQSQTRPARPDPLPPAPARCGNAPGSRRRGSWPQIAGREPGIRCDAMSRNEIARRHLAGRQQHASSSRRMAMTKSTGKEHPGHNRSPPSRRTLVPCTNINKECDSENFLRLC